MHWIETGIGLQPGRKTKSEVALGPGLGQEKLPAGILSRCFSVMRDFFPEPTGLKNGKDCQGMDASSLDNDKVLLLAEEWSCKMA